MRKFGAFSAVAAAAAVMAPAALAATPHATVNSHRLNNHHLLMVRQLPRTSMKAETTLSAAQAAMRPALSFPAPTPSSSPLPIPPAGSSTCPPGQSGGSYCVGPPVPDTLFETISTNGTASEPVTTNGKDTLLVAFVQADGPKTGGQSVTVSGGGLTWTRDASQNQGLGDAEVWSATLPRALSKQMITATAATKGFDVNLSIVSFQNASGIGARTTAFSSRGAPSATITTTQPNSWVWASANDWGGDARRTVPSGQTAVIQVLDLTDRKAFWVQTTNNPTANAGTKVTINDTAPTTDPFNLALVEVL
ncbi:MAG TPA: hypothetical protein VGI55_18460 [Solirubrobacteraceae bacterium]